MKNTESKIGRGTLIKGGGTAALATLMMGALEGRAAACCSPIDLTFTDDPQVAAMTRRKGAASPIKGLRLWSTGATPTAPAAPWTLLFSILNSHINGKDENKVNHGKNGHPKPLYYTIDVYVMY